MTISDLILQVKSRIGELLTPSDELLTISMAEQPIDTYIKKALKDSVKSLYAQLPEHIINPVDARYAKVLENTAGYVILPTTSQASTIESCIKYGTAEIITITTPISITPAAFNSISTNIEASENDIYNISAAGSICINPYTSTYISVKASQRVIAKGDRFYLLGYYPTADIDKKAIIFYNSEGAGYFKNLVLSDDKVFMNIHDGILTLDTQETCLTSNIIPSVKPILETASSYVMHIPGDMIHLSDVKFASWSTGKPRIASPNSTLSELQRNAYTKGSYTKPVVILQKDFNGDFIAEVFSRKDTQDQITSLKYIPNMIPQMVQDNLIDCFAWLSASEYLISIGSQLAQSAMTMYQQKLKEKQV